MWKHKTTAKKCIVCTHPKSLNIVFKYIFSLLFLSPNPLYYVLKNAWKHFVQRSLPPKSRNCSSLATFTCAKKLHWKTRKFFDVDNFKKFKKLYLTLMWNCWTYFKYHNLLIKRARNFWEFAIKALNFPWTDFVEILWTNFNFDTLWNIDLTCCLFLWIPIVLFKVQRL
jgi:hypothetical protein